MSGVMALVSLDGRPIRPELPRAQLAAIAHRGEWKPKLWEGPGIALGHVNLPRTPEAEREVLPAADPTGRYWITWDGRLDNRDELAGPLGLDALQRREMTDADYVLAAFTKWGDDCVHHLLGDWAVVIWDSHESRLFCAKDPLGWRQLYYAEHEGILAVGSEPQQFFANGWLPKVANEDFVLRLLAWAKQEPDATCWLGTRELSGGAKLTVCRKAKPSVARATFWDVPRPRSTIAKPAEAIDEFRHTFRLACEARARSNRPIGVLLSGGLDSSYIAATLGESGHRLTPVVGFSDAFPAMDERMYSLEVTSHLGLEPLLVNLDDAWPLNPSWAPAETFDQPFHPPQGSILSKLAGCAAQSGVGVLLSGEGGDEWMTGGIPVGADRCAADAVARLNPGLGLRIIKESTNRRPSTGLIRAVYREFTPPRIQSIVGRFRGRYPWNGFPNFVNPATDWEALFESEPESIWNRRKQNLRNWEANRDAMGRATIAWRDCHVFTRHRIENRSPFNDLRVVELMASIPESVKRFSGRPKAVLRSAMRDVLPQGIVERRGKAAMNPLFDFGLSGPERSRAQRAVESFRLPGLNHPKALRAWSDWANSPYDGSQFVWGLVCAGLWSQQNGFSGRLAEVVGSVERR